MFAIKTEFSIIPLVIVALAVQSTTCTSNLSLGDYEQSMVFKQTQLISSLKNEVNSLIQEAEKEYGIKKAEISASSQQANSPESRMSEINQELVQLKAKFDQDVEAQTKEISNKYNQKMTEARKLLPSPLKIGNLELEIKRCREAMDNSLDHQIITTMSAKIFELEGQLFSLQMDQRTQSDLIFVYENNMSQEISAATYRAETDYSSVNAQINLKKDLVATNLNANQRISYAVKSIYSPVFQKIDILYFETINQLQYIKRDYENTKNFVYNIRNIVAWTPFDSTLEQINKERNDYESRRNCIEMAQNVNLDLVFDFSMALNHC